MKITLLCENTSSDIGCMAEWGFSAFVQTKNHNLLFDTGYSDVYLRNAENLNIDLEKTNTIALSHFHSDHSRGLQFHPFQSKKRIIFHPQVLEKLPEHEAEKIKSDFAVTTSSVPFPITENVIFLGEIPRTMDFENGNFNGDSMLDDSAIAIKTNNGVVVISGCSHAGICNICDYAKQITGLPLYAVIGGFHLFEEDNVTITHTIEYFKKEAPAHLYPMHCVDFPTLAKFHAIFGCRKYNAGDMINLGDANTP